MCDELSAGQVEKVTHLAAKLTEFCDQATQLIDGLKCSNIPVVFYMYSMLVRLVSPSDRGDDYADVTWNTMFGLETGWAQIFGLWQQIQTISLAISIVFFVESGMSISGYNTNDRGQVSEEHVQIVFLYAIAPLLDSGKGHLRYLVVTPPHGDGHCKIQQRRY